MTRSMVIYVDGSRVMADNRKSQSLGWAVVACHDDLLQERHGAVKQGIQSPISGHYEHLAFVQGVLYAKEQGVEFKDVTFLCDDQVFGYAQTYLHPANYGGIRADHIRTRLRTTLQHAFDLALEPLVLAAMMESRIHKIKGHRFEVYQERADYLAKHAARTALGLETKEPALYEDWLKKGLPKYEDKGAVQTTWYAPFVATLA